MVHDLVFQKNSVQSKAAKKAVKRLRKLFHGLTWNAADNSDKRGLEGEILWDLVSILRGPDNQDLELKSETSWPIRIFLDSNFFNDGYFGHSGNSQSSDSLFPIPPSPFEGEMFINYQARVWEQFEKKYPDITHHFFSHFIRAAWSYWLAR
jgi:hypothetical protein